ncbi:flagellar hook protein FlgE [Desulfonatronovibrio magnus]|uniref:flagellar hook protein FlgE n=1 Tax=Desulfonatronovibrio magnus TaxID=698827 RepID=UPI0005EB88EF|nr:flagellar hook protein FlgE [Desulfonatronovibrio magnus]
MSLSSSLYTGVSGLQAHGAKMGVIGNNIANVSTVGYKGSRMHFEDFMSQDINTSSGVGQVGRGTNTAAVFADFQQGALETTSEATDVSIGGDGFFVVSPKGSEENYYTRAGNFRFDKEGFLVDPSGNVVQGWEIRPQTIQPGVTATQGQQVQIQGVPQNIQLENFQSPPEETSRVTKIVNLDSSAPSATGAGAEIFDAWDATQDPPIDPALYIHQTSMKVYDENGGAHTLTTYFDRMDSDDETNWLASQNPPLPNGYQVHEFIVTVPPEDDQRPWGPVPGAQNQGIVMQGRAVFNAAGEMMAMRDLENFTPGPGQTVPSFDDLDNPDGYSQNGYPLMGLSFLGAVDPVTGLDEVQLVELNFGIKNNNGAQDQAWISGALSSTSYSAPSSTVQQSQDGYGPGQLQNVEIDRDGVLTGRYSNGQVLELYALTLADFNNKWGLRREGSNLFSETRSSGDALTGLANSGSFGSIAGNSLEMSNVDLATEFVKMITTEKGFQANSKTITTTDQMLNVLIQMKR